MTWTPSLILRAVELAMSIATRAVEAERRRRNVSSLTDEEVLEIIGSIRIDDVDDLIARGAARRGKSL